MAVATPSLAQTPWTIDGITFAQRDGWCSKTVTQPMSGGGSLEVLEMRPCEKEFPYLSVGMAERGPGKADLPMLANHMANVAEEEASKQEILDLFRKTHASCTLESYAVNRAPLQGLQALEVTARASCPGLAAGSIGFRNLITLAVRGNGDLWTVAFDSPLAAKSEADEQMIRAAVATIATH
jgi:hypothetical protein